MRQIISKALWIFEVDSFKKKCLKSARSFISFVVNFVTQTPKLSSIYYAFVSRHFHNEHFAVISGISKNKSEIGNMGNFRRNIHRIEKGLITFPAKPVFAESCIIDTVQSLKILIKNSTDTDTIYWALGVLTTYFAKVTETETILCAKKEFHQIKKSETDNFPTIYLASDRTRSNISFEDLFELNLQRRSVRYYQNKIVPRNLVEKAIKLALQAPSACNRQPFMFRIFDEPLLIREAAQLPIGANTFSDNMKMMIFIIGDLSNYFDERDKHLIYIDSSLAVMSFVLALETLGLSSCIINWSDIPANNKKLKLFLNLEKWEQCVMSISVGYADPLCGILSSVKKEYKNVIKYN